MFNKKKVIYTYSPNKIINDLTFPPTPAKSFIPEWYKKVPRYSGDSKLKVFNGGTNLTMKACVPYFDAMSSGYIIPLWCDIQVSQGENGPELAWTSELSPVTFKTHSSAIGLQKINGFSDWVFSWNIPWGIKTPKGYSSLLVHPMNRTDLPFQVVSGIIDTDNYSAPGLATFCISSTFEGMIEVGTPILQILPIKRESWAMKKNDSLREIEEIKRKKLIGVASGGEYKKKFWEKKDYV